MSSPLLLRSIRRRANLEIKDPESFCETEFRDSESAGLDQRASVYAIGGGDLCRLHAEVLASAYDRPDFKGTTLNLHNLADDKVYEEPGESRFAFAKAAHREIRMASQQEVRDLAAMLIAQIAEREHLPAEAGIKEYVQTKLADRDVEWTQCCTDKPKWLRWAKPKQQAQSAASKSSESL